VNAVSAAIAAHPVRSAYVEQTLAILDREVPVAYDQRGEPSKDPQRRWATARSAWILALEGADSDGWCAVLQDDALPCADMLAGLERALDHLPTRDTAVSLYFGTRRPRAQRCTHAAALARRAEASWIATPTVNWAVALALPARSVGPMLAWCEKHRAWNVDKRIGRFVTMVKHWPTHNTWPSLVDHRQGPSICGHHDPDRMAHLHHQGSALDLTWTGPVVDATRTPPSVRRAVRSVA
jgi:hypothetical protein